MQREQERVFCIFGRAWEQLKVAYTASDDVDWAFCVPLRSEACSGWALYVTGLLAKDSQHDIEKSVLNAPNDLEDDVKFAELVGTTIANLRQTLRLERRQSEMRHFFCSGRHGCPCGQINR